MKVGGLELWAHRGIFHGSTIENERPLSPPRFGENTVPAFRASAKRGFDPELDVMATADGYAIVTHGDENGALDNGTLSFRVNTTSLADLQRFGLVANGNGDLHLPPTFEMFLDAIIPADVRPNVELKGPGSADAVAQSLRSYGVRDYDVDERFLFSSFDLVQVQRFRELFPRAAIALLLWSGDDRLRGAVNDAKSRFDRFIRDNRVCALHVDLPLAQEGYVEWAADVGCTEGVRAYTCNRPEQAIELHARGIMGIFTDFPEVIATELA